MYDQSEDAQLEAAIRASLEQAGENQHICYDLTDSDEEEDSISFPSEEESDEQESNRTPIQRRAVSLGSKLHVTEYPLKRCSIKLSAVAVAGQKRCARTEEEQHRGRRKIPKLEEVRTSTASSSFQLSATVGESGGRYATECGKGKEEDMSCVLVRFPDGRRVEKAFPANQHLQVCIL